MDISPAHSAAVYEACRMPALEARLALLASDTSARSRIEFFTDPRPDPGEPPENPPIAALEMTARAGVINASMFRIEIDTPLEVQVTDADPAVGSVPTWARIYRPNGDWWADMSVSAEGEGGEIQLTPTGIEGGNAVTRLFNGAFLRLMHARIQG